MIRIYCDAAHAVLKETEVLTSGMTNYPQVLLTFSEDWDGMGKVAVCRAGPSTEQSVDVEGLVTYALGSTFVVPSECLAQSGVELYIGIQGVNAQAEVAIPTIWVSAGTIMEGVDIDEATNTGTATPTLVQQMIAYAGQMEDTADDLAQNVIRQVLVNDTYANRYGTVDVELTDTGAGENRQLTFTFANLKGNGLESIAFVSTGTNTGRVVVTESNGNVTNYDGIKDALEYVYNYIDHNVSTIITDYIELHPEYVTTVMDGAVSYQKLDTELQGLADIVRDLDTIPTRTSDLINDSNFVSDANYVHTDSNFTANEKTKLDGIESGAQVNTVTGVKGSNQSSYQHGDISLSATDVQAVPRTRTINGYDLTANRTLTAEDIGYNGQSGHTSGSVGAELASLSGSLNTLDNAKIDADAAELNDLSLLGYKSLFFVTTQNVAIGSTGVSIPAYSRCAFINYYSADGALFAITTNGLIITAFRNNGTWINAQQNATITDVQNAQNYSRVFVTLSNKTGDAILYKVGHIVFFTSLEDFNTLAQGFENIGQLPNGYFPIDLVRTNITNYPQTELFFVEINTSGLIRVYSANASQSARNGSFWAMWITA